MVLPDFLTRDPDGFIHVTGHRIGLLHLMYYYREGDSPERLLQRFPTLSLPLIRQVIAFAEKNKEVDAYLASCLAEMEQQRAAAPPAPTLEELRRRLQALYPGWSPTTDKV